MTMDLDHALASRSAQWLVTGAAGFIGSHLVEALLRAGQKVRGLDNFATGHRSNLEDVRIRVGAPAWANFAFMEADIRDRAACAAAVRGVDHVLHQAALGSVPRSLADPLTTHDVNATGFANVIDAARLAGVASFAYASSSSVYGDEPNLPKVEDRLGRVLSPYALTKLHNELTADVYRRGYGFGSVGLRYFNVFGPRQDPEGAYAAVIPRWAAAMIAGEAVAIHGDGETSRDFCYVANAVQANLRAALFAPAGETILLNIAVGERTSLTELFGLLRDGLAREGVAYGLAPDHGDFRAGDVRHSLADIGAAERTIGYRPSHRIEEGLAEALPWYRQVAKVAGR
ncbi:NAD-dependent epimerase/dehydratase family protein [Rhizorhabdus dicambivorans]|uniref:LPS biosynthesis protein WbpP n=1 Tax=Rhizorhabdus dicambivorans TaxID=1850238 RepID=A0A2A4FU02_9SPHN|nr:NAD-dependent epimerase/dehydratase family protein [Rhizorhabdus dicambivorans]ATE64524.1 LPS biosynthesis protein WbpP [Rhizorhabdus dicambivorans]PCE41619.1 LPS biosynthesis protein WbpP [Rhizorhabdus dicambivorans]